MGHAHALPARLVRNIPQVAQRRRARCLLHGYTRNAKRRLFTCSEAFTLPTHDATLLSTPNARDIHLPLGQTDPARLTLLLGDLFPLFYNALMNVNVAQAAQPSPFLRLGRQLFLLEGLSSPTRRRFRVDRLYLAHYSCRADPKNTLQSHITSFASGIPAPTPPPHLAVASSKTDMALTCRCFHNLNLSSQSPAPLGDIAPPNPRPPPSCEERIEHYLEDGVIVIDYDLKTTVHVHFHNPFYQRGFQRPDHVLIRCAVPTRKVTEMSLTLRQQIFAPLNTTGLL